MFTLAYTQLIAYTIKLSLIANCNKTSRSIFQWLILNFKYAFYIPMCCWCGRFFPASNSGYYGDLYISLSIIEYRVQSMQEHPLFFVFFNIAYIVNTVQEHFFCLYFVDFEWNITLSLLSSFLYYPLYPVAFWIFRSILYRFVLSVVLCSFATSLISHVVDLF